VTYDDRESVIQGASYTYTATVRVTASDPLVLAWYTVKANISDADPGVLQKKVTTSNVAGTGQITADGSAAGTATIRFDITSTDTTAPHGAGIRVRREGQDDVRCVRVRRAGPAQVHRNVTTSTS
jgi:hypothetical protein